MHGTMGGADVVLPRTATEEGVPELAVVLEHFQDHIAVIADEGLEGDGASAAAGEAIAVCDVAEMRKLAGAAAIRAGGGFVNGGSHGFQDVRLSPRERTIQQNGARFEAPLLALYIVTNGQSQ